MSTEIEPYKPHTDVDSWTEAMPSVVKLAEYIQDTEFIPKVLRNRPAAIAAAILSGREMGIGPMRALSHVHMIEGRPSLSAEQKRAAALAAGHDIVYVESTVTRCVVKGRRNGSEAWSTVTWTLDDAKAAGISGRDNWRRHPRRMLQARATGELVDMLFPDAAAGLATTEELIDDTDATGIHTDSESAPAKRTARRRTPMKTVSDDTAETSVVAETPPQPLLPGEDDTESPETTPETVTIPTPPLPDMITAPQRAKMLALFNGIGIRDRSERLTASTAIINREVETANQLTKHEASALIDTLERVSTEDDPAAALRLLLAETEAQRMFNIADIEIMEERQSNG